MEKWIFDSPDQAGEAYRQFMKDFYQGNKLIQGQVEIGHKRVDLGNIRIPILNMVVLNSNGKLVSRNF
jgi:polyhydroxyalkanoate synthase